jgi:hypothetical protein
VRAIGKLPVDVAMFLRDVAEWLDTADVAIEMGLEQKGMRWDSTPDIQDDVRRLAEWFEKHPHIDIAAFTALTGWWDPAIEKVPPPDPVWVAQRLRALAV